MEITKKQSTNRHDVTGNAANTVSILTRNQAYDLPLLNEQIAIYKNSSKVFITYQPGNNFSYRMVLT
jgi:hypothetical protein